MTILDEPCRCGSAFRLIGDIQGRLDDTFVYDGRPINAHVFRSPLSRRSQIVEYQVRQTPRGAELAVRRTGRVDIESLENEIASALAALGLDAPEVAITTVDHLERLATGKLKRFVPLGKEVADSAQPQREYLLGAREDERQRLLGQAEAIRDPAAALLDRIGVGPGWQVADLGCGPSGILDLLCERVGPTGRVLAVERDPQMIEHLTLTLQERCLSDVEIVQADATATGLDPARLDLAHTRLLLVNVFGPQLVVAEMFRLVRPGGVVAVQDVDISGFGCFPSHPAYDRLLEVIVTAWQDGRDPFIGRRVPGLFVAAGVSDIHTDCFTLLQRHGDRNHRIVPFFGQLMREPILAAALLRADELEELCAAVEDHLAQPGVITMWGPVYQVGGRRPRSS